jgi:hypothetical protein
MEIIIIGHLAFDAAIELSYVVHNKWRSTYRTLSFLCVAQTAIHFDPLNKIGPCKFIPKYFCLLAYI